MYILITYSILALIFFSYLILEAVRKNKKKSQQDKQEINKMLEDVNDIYTKFRQYNNKYGAMYVYNTSILYDNISDFKNFVASKNPDINQIKHNFKYLLYEYNNYIKYISSFEDAYKKMIDIHGLDCATKIIKDFPYIGVSADIVRILCGEPNVIENSYDITVWEYSNKYHSGIYIIQTNIVIYIR
jgi:hypothetical protein